MGDMEEESAHLGPTNKTKNLILIRHAQSEENVKVIDHSQQHNIILNHSTQRLNYPPSLGH